MKAAQIDAALKQLAYEIAGDTATYDTLTAVLVMNVIDRFINDDSRVFPLGINGRHRPHFAFRKVVPGSLIGPINE